MPHSKPWLALARLPPVLSGGVLAAADLNAPIGNWVGAHPVLQTSALVFTMGWGAIMPFVGAHHDAKQAKQRSLIEEERAESARRREIETIVRRSFISIQQQSKVDWLKLGLSVYELDPTRSLLKRVCRMRHDPASQPRREDWPRSKGAVGMAWAEGQLIEAVFDQPGMLPQNAGAWMALTQRERTGLTWQEYQPFRTLGAVLACPVRDSQGVAGVVSLDCPHGQSSKITKAPVTQELGTLAQILSTPLEARPG